MKYDDYITVKKQLYEEKNEKITEQILAEEKIKFKLIDVDSNGYITWNEYLEFETAEILSKMNKVKTNCFAGLKEKIITQSTICLELASFVLVSVTLGYS